jgi:hypothetical protein
MQSGAAGQIIVSTGMAGRLGMPFSMAPVTGQPYSGEEVSESVQTLADGTHINQTLMQQRVYRDSQGRTRTERSLMHPGMSLPAGEEAPMMIDIMDPVAQVRYSLDTRSKIAHRWAMPTVAGSAHANAGFGAMLSPVAPLTTMAAVKTQAVSPGDPSQPHAQTENLDPQTIDGIAVEGRRTTITYPAGSVGNDREFVTTMEMWTSPELGVAVLNKNSDPRNGDHTQRLTKISRNEPDASLFQPPAGYEVVEEKTGTANVQFMPVPAVQKVRP